MSSAKKGERPRKVIFFLGFNFREKQRKIFCTPNWALAMNVLGRTWKK